MREAVITHTNIRFELILDSILVKGGAVLKTPFLARTGVLFSRFFEVRSLV
jgi:hypothetical protein